MSSKPKEMKKQVQTSGNQSINKDCVVYYRVSSNPQETERQKMECLDYCKINDYNIVCKPFEEKKSGRKEDRQVMNNCLKYIKDNNIHYLIISEISRLSRSLEGSTILHQLTKDKVCVIGIMDKVKTLNDDFSENREETAKASGAITEAIKESNRTSYRVINSKRASVLYRGIWTGGKYLPFGYQSVNKKLVIDPKEAEIVGDIFNKYLSGWGAIKISNWLNLQNIPTKLNQKWLRSTINQMLPHRLYIGKRQYDGKDIDTPDLKIIDENIFYAVQKRMKERKNTDLTFNQLKKYDYLFSGLIVCGVCGKKYYGLFRDNQYKCSSGKYHGGCGNPSIKIDWIDEKIKTRLFKDWKKLIYDNTTIVKQTEQMETEIKLLEQDRKEHQELLKRYNDIYIRNRMTLEEYNKKCEASENQLEKIGNRIGELNNKIIGNIVYINQHKQTDKYIKDDLTNDAIKEVIKSITINKLTTGKQIVKVELINGNQFEVSK